LDYVEQAESRAFGDDLAFMELFQNLGAGLKSALPGIYLFWYVKG
jgi:hypothetical protein